MDHGKRNRWIWMALGVLCIVGLIVVVQQDRQPKSKVCAQPATQTGKKQEAAANGHQTEKQQVSQTPEQKADTTPEGDSAEVTLYVQESVQDMQGIMKLHMVDKEVGWLATLKSLLHTADDGKTWFWVCNEGSAEQRVDEDCAGNDLTLGAIVDAPAIPNGC